MAGSGGMARFCFLAGILLLYPAAVFAVDHVWIVGGGPTLFNSQAQIELNVKWEREVVLRQNPKARMSVFFGSGSSLEKDVVAWRHPEESPASMQPLARVFGANFQNGEWFYKNSVPGIAGETRSKSLDAHLQKEFANVSAGDKALFIFYGHGSRDPSDNSGHVMRLWGDTRKTASDLVDLLSGINKEAPVRIFLPQCYSGGFAKSIYAGSLGTGSTKAARMCGFMAVADDMESEGCSPSIKVGDYRDYSSYFFAALDGRTRTGAPLPASPDHNRDGKVTLREAHFYSLVYGESTDVPRSTSDVFLENWEPWYLRPFSAQPDPGNIYRQAMTILAARNGLPAGADRFVPEARSSLSDSGKQIALLKKEQDDLFKKTESLRATIKADVLARWPETSSPYTGKYRDFLLNQLNAAQQYIMQRPDYSALVDFQEQYMELDTQILASKRKYAQFERILRLHKLAQMLEKFERHAGRSDRAAYDKLVACEETTL